MGWGCFQGDAHWRADVERFSCGFGHSNDLCRFDFPAELVWEVWDPLGCIFAGEARGRDERSGFTDPGFMLRKPQEQGGLVFHRLSRLGRHVHPSRCFYACIILLVWSLIPDSCNLLHRLSHNCLTKMWQQAGKMKLSDKRCMTRTQS